MLEIEKSGRKVKNEIEKKKKEQIKKWLPIFLSAVINTFIFCPV